MCAGYDEEARYFDSGVKQEKQAELVQKLHEAVHPAFSAQLGHLRKATLLTFQQSLKTTLGAHPRTFAAAASRYRQASPCLCPQMLLGWLL